MQIAAAHLQKSNYTLLVSNCMKWVVKYTVLGFAFFIMSKNVWMTLHIDRNDLEYGEKSSGANDKAR